MNIGTKSVLFGAHQFLLHPWFVALAWWKLYGFPWDPRLWVAFFVHDLGYIGKPNMDGQEGDLHPELGAKIMGSLFGGEWGAFTLLHSRFMARRLGLQHSRLCVADKLATALTPAWLYLPMVRLTGEIDEYMHRCGVKEASKYFGELNTPEENALLLDGGEREWFDAMTSYLRRWAEAHRDGSADTWTPRVVRE